MSESNLHRENGWNVVKIEYSTDTVVIAVYTSDVGKFGGIGKAVQSVSCDSSAIITVTISIGLLVGFELRSCTMLSCTCSMSVSINGQRFLQDEACARLYFHKMINITYEVIS